MSLNPNHIKWTCSTSKRDLVTIVATSKLNHSAEEMWAILSKAGYLTDVNQYVEENTSDQWAGVGNEDFFRYRNGKEFTRTLESWDENEGIRLKLAALKPKKQKNQIWVHFLYNENEDKTIDFSITIKVDSFRNVPRPLWWLYASSKVEHRYKSYMTHLMQGYEHYLRTGKAVKPNQFGSNKTFE